MAKTLKMKNDIRFHGKPDKIFPLKNSEIENVTEKIRIREMLLNFLKKYKINVANP